MSAPAVTAAWLGHDFDSKCGVRYCDHLSCHHGMHLSGIGGDPCAQPPEAHGPRPAALSKAPETRGLPYGEWCRQPDLCRGKGSCPRDPNCGD